MIHFLQFCSWVWLWVIWAFAHLVTILCFAVVFLLLCLSCASLKFRSSSKQVQERYSFKVWRAGCLLQNRFREDISKSFWRQVFIFFFSDVFQFTSHQLMSQWGLTYWRNILYPLVTHQPCESLNMMHLSPWGADMLLFLLVLQFWWMFFVFELNKSCQILLCFQKSLEVSGFVSWLAQKLWVYVMVSVLPAAEVIVWRSQNSNVAVFSDTINVIMSNLAWWYLLFSFTCSYHFQWAWPYVKVTVKSNSFNWKFSVLIRLSWKLVRLLSKSSR